MIGGLEIVPITLSFTFAQEVPYSPCGPAPMTATSVCEIERPYALRPISVQIIEDDFDLV
jgi:hypothetical protein